MGGLVLSSVAPQSFPLQFLFWLIAFVAFITFSQSDIRMFKSIGVYFYVFSVVLLLATLFLADNTRGAKRWIYFGELSLQPSELIKPFLVIFFASVLDVSWSRFLSALAAFAFVAGLIFIQPDLGSVLVVFAAFLGSSMFSRFSLKRLLLVLVILALLSPLGWGFLADYQKQRILAFLTPLADPQGAGYNAVQSMIAVGSGMLTGQGLGQGVQSQLAFLPERHTDFIFASLSEELGFIGSFLTLLAFALILGRIIVLIKKEDDYFLQSLLGGIFMIIFAQAGINVGMNLGLLPITGIPLPLVSSGGSSLVATSIMLGMISSISTLRTRLNSNILSS